MTGQKQNRGTSGTDLRVTIAAYALALLMIFPATQLHAQTFTVLHTFTGAGDGANPYAGLTMDRSGNFYGTASAGGSGGWGTVFKLIGSGSRWTFKPLYGFQGTFADGFTPMAAVTIAADGSLYGTTLGGFAGQCCGLVYNLKPSPTRPPSALAPWLETVLYHFDTDGSPDGYSPVAEVTLDSAGNLYGTTQFGGVFGSGTVWELSRNDGGWTESILHSFDDFVDGSELKAGVIFDPSGNLYGTTFLGRPSDDGTVFQLVPSSSGWTLHTLHSFGDGGFGFAPQGGVILDGSGNLYGDTINGPGGEAVVFELTPSGGGWTYNVLYGWGGSLGGGPAARLTMDAAGNLYGTTRGLPETNNLYGSVFKLTPSNGGWIYTDLHDFTGGSDGAYPVSNVVLDANGNLYGTASEGGAGCRAGCGVVWEITL
jgi:uncharacterized repeat protein (TIGR03803 family)